MGGLTLDAGALIAAERGDRRFWGVWKEALARDLQVTVPAPVVAQVFRGARSVVVIRLLRGCIVAPLDERSARLTGILCGESGTADVVDAAVIEGAFQRRDDVLTSDPDELRHLKTYRPGCGAILPL